MKKTISVLSASILSLSLLAGASFHQKAEAALGDWNTARYGDVIDVVAYLRDKADDEEYQAEVKEKVEASAKKAGLTATEEKGQKGNKGKKAPANEEAGTSGANTESTFTFDGGTKQFLNYDYSFEPFTLRSIGENVEVWVAHDLGYPEGDSRAPHVVTQEQVDKLAAEFDQNMYEKEVDFFGKPDTHTGESALLSEWGYVPENYYSPDDGKDRVILLVDNIPDENYRDPSYPFFVAGFYSPTFEGYFDRNIINIDSADWENRLENTFYGTTAHEFQHLIHDDNDSDESTWINEGMSDFAEYLVGYGHPMGHVNYFLDHPENSLVEWDEYYNNPDGPETLADYGQAYLMQLYFNDHYGQEFIRALAKDTENGIASVEKNLEAVGEDVDFNELFRRFSLAVAMDDPELAGGIYNFDSIDLNVNWKEAAASDKDGVPAWGADYMVMKDTSKVENIEFDGIDFMPTPWEVVEDPLGSGEQVLWGNEGHEMDNGIVVEADLTDVDSATLQFDNYIDIEEQWDFGMVQVSTDGGKTWTSLANENTRSDIVPEGYPAIKENLPGFTGYYDDWMKETFDLTPYAGQNVLIAFRYMTDWASNDSGWFIDNIEIPEIGYMHDGNSLDGLKSVDEVTGTYVDYVVSFINEKSLGDGNNDQIYDVLNMEPFNVTEADTVKLKDFLSGGNNYMVVWYAAPLGKKGAVDYSYKIETKSEVNKKK